MTDRLRLMASDVPVIIGREQYLETAVMVPFLDLPGGPHLLFEKRSATVRQPGEICFPGGVYEPALDDSLRETAVRETHEELGLSRDKILISGCLGTLVGRMGLIVEAYIGLLDIRSIDELKVQQSETEAVFTLPLTYFLERSPEIYKLRMEVQPWVDQPGGGREMLFPAEQLGLPDRYHRPWNGPPGRVFVWNTPHGALWGITAELVNETVKRWKKTGA